MPYTYILENFSGFGLKTVFGLPVGEALLSIGATFQIFHYIQYGKRSKNYEAIPQVKK